MHTARLLTVSHVGGLLHPERLDRPPPPSWMQEPPSPDADPPHPSPEAADFPWRQPPPPGCRSPLVDASWKAIPPSPNGQKE